MAKRCICHEHRTACDCADNPEMAFVSRAAQIAGAVMMIPVAAMGIILAAALFGSVIDTATEYQAGRERCLKQATNGYEIEQCK